MTHVITTHVAGGVIVWFHGYPVACGPDRLKALAEYERLRVSNPNLPAIEWVEN